MGGKKILRVGLCGAALILVIAVVIYAATPKEPRYQGRTLTQWVDSASSNGYSPSFSQYRFGFFPSNSWAAASNAMQQMGSDALPWLVNWSVMRDSKLQNTVVQWVNSHPSFHVQLAPPPSKRDRAKIGFELLGTNAVAATPLLIKKTFARDPKTRAYALESLESIQPPHETLFPVCFHLMSDPDVVVRAKASWCENDLEMAMTLQGDIKSKQLFLSPLLRWVNDPDPAVRQHSAKLLHFYFPQEAEKAGVYQTFPELRNTKTAVNTF